MCTSFGEECTWSIRKLHYIAEMSTQNLMEVKFEMTDKGHKIVILRFGPFMLRDTCKTCREYGETDLWSDNVVKIPLMFSMPYCPTQEFSRSMVEYS